MNIRSLAERVLDAGFGHPRGIAGRLGGDRAVGTAPSSTCWPAVRRRYRP
jgi:hypothetical protein